MNKNQLIGIALLLLLLNIFFIRMNKNNNDNNAKKNNIEINKDNNNKENVNNLNVNNENSNILREDKAKLINFEDIKNCKNENLILENDFIKYTFSNIGASIIDVELKNYNTF